MIIQIVCTLSVILNISLAAFSCIVLMRKRSYKDAFHKNVGRCKKILENERKYKELSKNINEVFIKLKVNMKEQVGFIDQANQIILQEDEITQEMIEISGDFRTGVTP